MLFSGALGSVQGIVQVLGYIFAAALIISVHEFAHAFAAVKSGDITPKIYKRYTLNPIAHFDPIGIVMLALIGFGWAKPVPVNPSNFNNQKKGAVWVSIAGVLSNYVFAFLVYPLVILVIAHIPDMMLFDDFIKYFFVGLFSLNLIFCVFNLLPFYPLDGFRLFEALNKKRGAIYMFLRNYGNYILLGLIFLGLFVRAAGLSQFDFLRIFLSFAVNLIERPIILFWGIIF